MSGVWRERLRFFQLSRVSPVSAGQDYICWRRRVLPSLVIPFHIRPLVVLHRQGRVIASIHVVTDDLVGIDFPFSLVKLFRHDE